MQETAIEQKMLGNVKGWNDYGSVPTNLSAFAEGCFETFLGMVLHVLFYQYLTYGGVIYRNTLASYSRLSIFQLNVHGDLNQEETET